MISRGILAVVVGVAVTLIALLVGSLLQALHLDLAVVVGGFLVTWAAVIGILAALWYFFNGRI